MADFADTPAVNGNHDVNTFKGSMVRSKHLHAIIPEQAVLGGVMASAPLFGHPANFRLVFHDLFPRPLAQTATDKLPLDAQVALDQVANGMCP